MEWYYYLIIGAGALVVLLALYFLLFKGKKKETKVKIDNEFIDNLIALLGDIKNIKGVDLVNGRVKIEVNDLDLVKLDEIKELASSGFFVTGNVIKILFKYDSELVKKSIESRI